MKLERRWERRNGGDAKCRHRADETRAKSDDDGDDARD